MLNKNINYNISANYFVRVNGCQVNFVISFLSQVCLCDRCNTGVWKTNSCHWGNSILATGCCCCKCTTAALTAPSWNLCLGKALVTNVIPCWMNSQIAAGLHSVGGNNDINRIITVPRHSSNIAILIFIIRTTLQVALWQHMEGTQFAKLRKSIAWHWH